MAKLKKIFFFLSIILILIFTTSQNLNTPDNGYKNVRFDDSTITVQFSCVGDLMCHSTQYNYAWVALDSFNFKPVFREIRKYLKSSDFVMGNLETVISDIDRKYSGYPFFDTPQQFLEGLKYAGFNLLFTANNHSLDQGKEGIIRTINKANMYGMNIVGTYLSQNDRDSVRIYSVKGLNVAVLAYTYSTNGKQLSKENEFMISTIDTLQIKNDILNARQRNCDAVIVYLHYGTEYEREPSSYQKGIAAKVLEYGADVILGSHTHTVQPVDYFKTTNSSVDTALVVYSLGNFISNQRWRYSDAGVILNFSINKNLSSDSVYISNISFLPTWVFKGKTQYGKEYIILPSEYAFVDSNLNYLNDKARKLMKESFYDNLEIINKYNNKTKLKKLPDVEFNNLQFLR